MKKLIFILLLSVFIVGCSNPNNINGNIYKQGKEYVSILNKIKESNDQESMDKYYDEIFNFVNQENNYSNETKNFMFSVASLLFYTDDIVSKGKVEAEGDYDKTLDKLKTKYEVSLK